MDPRRRMDEKFSKAEQKTVPFIESYREIILEEQVLGPKIEREIIVIRIDIANLKLYGIIFAFLVAIVGLGFLRALAPL